jgi:hypothetical protein
MEPSPSPEQQHSKFDAAMPEIPGVAHNDATHPPHAWTYVAVAALLLSAFSGVWWLLHTPAPSGAAAPGPAPSQIDPPPVSSLPAAPDDSAASLNDAGPVEQFAEPWSSKQFMYSHDLSREKQRAVVIRLPGGNEHSPASYWAFLLQEPYGQCQLEYVSDLQRIADKFAFAAQHPMVVDSCTNTVFDPLKMATLPTGAWVRGDIVKGPGFRPPFGIEVKIEKDHIVAGRAEE